MRQDNQSTAPTLQETIKTLIEAALMDLHVSIPAKIVTYDASTQYADVEIQLQFAYENGSVMKWPVIPNIPVKHPRANGGQAFIHMPLVAGDDVMLVVCERSLDNWKTQGGMTDPQDRRKFDMSDCYALIGGSAIPDAFTVTDPTAIEMINGSSAIQLLSSGGVNLGSTSPTHAVALADNVLSRIEALENAYSSFLSAYDAHLHPTTAPGSPTGPPAEPADPYSPPSDPLGSSKVMVET